VILDQDPTAIDPERLDGIKIVQTIKEGVVVFDSGQATAGLRPTDPGQLAFTRALAATAGHHDPSGHDHGNGCLCGALSQIADVLAGGELR
jgi:hypothetical protein